MAEAEVLFAEAQASDAGALVVFLAQAMTESDFITQTSPSLSETQMATFLSRQEVSPRDICLLAKLGEGIIACLNLVAYPKAGSYFGDIFLVVGRAYQGAGLGQTLLELVIDWAQESKCLAGLSLSVQVRNQRAIHIYQKFGFSFSGLEKASVKSKQGQDLDVYLMTRAIK